MASIETEDGGHRRPLRRDPVSNSTSEANSPNRPLILNSGLTPATADEQQPKFAAFSVEGFLPAGQSADSDPEEVTSFARFTRSVGAVNGSSAESYLMANHLLTPMVDGVAAPPTPSWTERSLEAIRSVWKQVRYFWLRRRQAWQDGTLFGDPNWDIDSPARQRTARALAIVWTVWALIATVLLVGLYLQTQRVRSPGLVCPPSIDCVGLQIAQSIGFSQQQQLEQQWAMRGGAGASKGPGVSVEEVLARLQQRKSDFLDLYRTLIFALCITSSLHISGPNERLTTFDRSESNTRAAAPRPCTSESVTENRAKRPYRSYFPRFFGRELPFPVHGLPHASLRSMQ